jgi:hypothetical protein
LLQLSNAKKPTVLSSITDQGTFFIGPDPDLVSSLELFRERTFVQRFFNLAANGLKKMNFLENLTDFLELH